MRRKFSLLTLVMIFIFAFSNVGQAETNTGGYIPSPINLSRLADNPPQENNGNHLLLKASPGAKYDLRDDGYVTSVKSQSPYGTCWAFAAIGAMESNYLKNGGGEIDLSEMHLAWFTYANATKSKAFKNYSTSSNLKTVLEIGGNSFYPAAIYGRLDGPVLESEVPYGEGKKPSATSPNSYNRVLRLRDVYYLAFTRNNVNKNDQNREIIKNRIKESGAVVVNYDNDDSYYKEVKTGEVSYYSKGTSINHAVLIIGWDDNYSKENFDTKPSIDGAWLIKNSWANINPATSKYDNNYDGCFWMSYEQYLVDGSAFIVEEANSDMKAYYYDALGWCGSVYVPYGANIFKSERDGEILNEVAFFTPDNNVKYEIQIYTGISSITASPVSGTLAASQTATEPYAGYHTITLDNPVNLTKGEYFSVVVKFSVDEFPVELKESGYSNNATIESGSFVSYNGSNWYSRAGEDNVCIRAFTTTGSNLAPKITTASLPDGFLNTAYNQQLLASGSRPLKWEFTDGKMPSGLAISSLGILSGTPKETGNFTFTIKVMNENTGDSDSKTYTLGIIDKPEITTGNITGYIGYAVNETLQLASGTAKSWSITSGTLPKGLKFTESTGKITGKPTAKGEYSVTFKATGSSWEVSKNINFEILAKPTKPVISTSKLTDGEIEEEYSAELKISGTEPITLSANGLPAGLSMSSSGEFSGTPTVAGNFTIKITASNIFTELNKTTVTKNVKLKINAKQIIFEDVDEENFPMAIVNEKFDGYKFELSQGTEPITWTASNVPAGLSLNSKGEISGTPKRAGKFNMTVKAKNLAGMASLRVPIVVYQIPSITTAKLSNATTGKNYTAKLKAAGTTPITEWKIDSLPNTLTFTANEKGDQVTISGTPTSADTYNLAITATNAAGTSETKNLTLTVNGVKPRLKATLAKAEVGDSYTDSEISATGTFPIEFSYSISNSDKTKFGINDLSDIGLTFSSNPYAGTAEITGTPTQSIKSLPITITAKNVAGTVTKKLSFTAKGDKPSFESSTPDNLTETVNSAVNFTVSLTGSPKIVISMSKVSGFTLTQNGDGTATVSGTSPNKAGKTTFKITASNADGKVTKKIVLQTTKEETNNVGDLIAKVNDEIKSEKSETDLTAQALESENVSENITAVKNSDLVKFGEARSIKSLGTNELDALENCTVAAVMPILTVAESGLYDFEIELDSEIEADKELLYFAFAQNRDKNSDDEFAEFFDLDGRQITKTTAEHKILITVWLNAGDTYAPVIAVKNSDSETESKSE